jgi:hypothetical protein
MLVGGSKYHKYIPLFSEWSSCILGAGGELAEMLIKFQKQKLKHSKAAEQ